MYSCKKCPIHWTLSTSNPPFFWTKHRRSVCWRKPWSPVATASGSSWTPPWNGPRCRGPPIPSSATSRTLRRPWPRAKRWGRGIPMAMHAIMEWMKGWKICDLEMIFGQTYLLDDFFGGWSVMKPFCYPVGTQSFRAFFFGSEECLKKWCPQLLEWLKRRHRSHWAAGSKTLIFGRPSFAQKARDVRPGVNQLSTLLPWVYHSYSS